MKTLEGRAILVTGSANGMGREVTLAMASAGADLVLAGRDMDAIEKVAREVKALGRSVSVQHCDITDDSMVASAVTRGRETLGNRLDGLACIAGATGPEPKPLWECSVEEYREVFDVNVLGVMLPMRHVMPHLLEQGYGSVVSVGGTYGFKGVASQSLYCSTKWALRGLGKSVALEAGPHGVRVNSVCPGGVDGPRLERQLRVRAQLSGASLEDTYQDFANKTALKRMSTASDIAEAAVFLLSDSARNITGQDLLVDGGTIV